jgi:hypothetical protein
VESARVAGGGGSLPSAACSFNVTLRSSGL